LFIDIISLIERPFACFIIFICQINFIFSLKRAWFKIFPYIIIFQFINRTFFVCLLMGKALNAWFIKILFWNSPAWAGRSLHRTWIFWSWALLRFYLLLILFFLWYSFLRFSLLLLRFRFQNFKIFFSFTFYFFWNCIIAQILLLRILRLCLILDLTTQHNYLIFVYLLFWLYIVFLDRRIVIKLGFYYFFPTFFK